MVTRRPHPSEQGRGRLVARCTELRSYIENNKGALIDYGQRYRAGKPISTSRAEDTVNQLANARMNKQRQMRWSPRGAPSRASGQGRSAGRTPRPPSNPARDVTPQVFDTPQANLGQQAPPSMFAAPAANSAVCFDSRRAGYQGGDVFRYCPR